jgi:hypothetical protein
MQTYFDQVKALVDAYNTTSMVLQSQVQFEVRPGRQGYLYGSLTFHDGSVLHFREYLYRVGETIGKEMYTYHYQDATAALVFRYDNARHRPLLGMLEHKHTSDEVTEAAAPTLEEVLTEIVSTCGWGTPQ